jgi:hypothetical protein
VVPTIASVRRRLHRFVAALGTVTIASCVTAVDTSSTTSSQTPTASPPTTISDTVATATATTTTTTSTAAIGTTATTISTTTATSVRSPEDLARELCSFEATVVRGQVANPALDEASGLVASRRHGGVLWSHNDGADAGLFAIGLDGADLGFHPLMVEGARDVEDMALVSGPTGDDILLGDIGDNGANRPSIRIYRFAEPDPSVVAPITDVEVLEFVYPDRPHNAEVLLVDEDAARIVIVTKEQQRVDGVPRELWPTAVSFVFEGPLDGHGAGPVQLDALGTFDAPLLETRTVAEDPHPISLLGLGGLPTGGDVSPDGRLIALRTYETIWVWARQPGQSVGQALVSDPCQVPVAPERQGEAVAFLDGTLLTVSEGLNPFLFELGP